MEAFYLCASGSWLMKSSIDNHSDVVYKGPWYRKEPVQELEEKVKRLRESKIKQAEKIEELEYSIRLLCGGE